MLLMEQQHCGHTHRWQASGQHPSCDSSRVPGRVFAQRRQRLLRRGTRRESMSALCPPLRHASPCPLLLLWATPALVVVHTRVLRRTCVVSASTSSASCRAVRSRSNSACTSCSAVRHRCSSANDASAGASPPRWLPATEGDTPRLSGRRAGGGADSGRGCTDGRRAAPSPVDGRIALRRMPRFGGVPQLVPRWQLRERCPFAAALWL
jgi:hypothetical protein